MNYSEMTDEELIKIRKGRAKIALIGLILFVSALLSLLFFEIDIIIMTWVAICSCICGGCTIYVSKKNHPIDLELQRRNRQAISREIHRVVPADCQTVVTVSRNTLGLKQGKYYIWKEYNMLRFYPLWKVLKNPLEEVVSIAIEDIICYKVESYMGFSDIGCGVDTGCLRLIMVGQRQLICDFQDYNTLKIVLPEKDSAYIPNEGATSKGAKTSSADEIMKYKKLLDDGIITADEFEKKKRQLLDL